MKNFFKLCVILGMTVIMNSVVPANWIKMDIKSGLSSNEISSQQTNSTATSKSDSLPEGVTEDWLSKIQDENGNRVYTESSTNKTQEDPEVDAFQSKVFNGQTTESYFGNLVASAGDVNGDGYDDILVGASGYNSNTGRAYIYYGGVNMNTIADVTMTGDSIGNNFGNSVSTAGDVNGDGYSDIIIGENKYNSYTGRAYIYFGGVVMNNIPDVIMTGENTETPSSFGSSVSTAGDVNGDGFSDIIVSAEGYNYSTGKVYLYFGGVVMNNIADISITGNSILTPFGYTVSTAGDVNGDGYSDIIIGEYFLLYGFTGKAHVYFGGSVMDTIADVTINAGYLATIAGDVNGDGYSDIIVGAYISNQAYIFLGGVNMDNVADVTMTGDYKNIHFGISVSSAGDLNSDGYSDVIVGTFYLNHSEVNIVYVYFGGVSMNNTEDVTIAGLALSDEIGYTVSTAGDVNGDGYSEILVGAQYYNSNTGRAYLFDYSMKAQIVPETKLTGETISNNFGYSVSTAGDVNSDGYSDVIVGAYDYNLGTGRAYIFFGGAITDFTADVTLTGEAANNYFGCSVSTSGDVNGDGYSDIIVGAFRNNSYTGKAYIFYGGTSMDNIADVIMSGESANNLFGISVSKAGDVNSDGYSDVIVGANGYNLSTGRAYIYYGGSVMNNTADVIMTGEATGNNFGYSVFSAGDANGDGYSDIAVGASGYNSFTGRAYIYYGGSSMNNTADVVMTGEASGSYFGNSVSSAGDVNNDGFTDLIAGANRYNSNTGRAYIYYGGTFMNNTADVIMTGESTNNFFGSSVSSAGDLNADGYSDVIAGANGFDSFTGKAYVYFGGSAMNNTADVTMTGEAINQNLGNSVSAAGDLNSDGYSDLIVGAYGDNSNTGKANIYTGSAISFKPILNYVKDFPNDQGGKVYLKWSRCLLDVNGVNEVTNYSVLRSYPPTGGNYAWQEVATITARTFLFYSYTDTTLIDSSANNSGTFFYRIRANTSNPAVFYNTSILSGRSIDNLAPIAVNNFTAIGVTNNVRLNWKKNTEPDLYNYILYRSINANIDPDSLTPYVTLTDTTYLDTTPLTGLFYYFIKAQDIHNNKSLVAITQSPNITVNITLLIEGFYNSLNNDQVSDSIKAYLRNNTSPYSFVDSASSIVLNNGNAVLSFRNAPSGTYYIEIRHRNSIETWSKANGVSLSSGNSVSYNFSNAASQAFGNNMAQVNVSPVRFAIFSGDVDQDGIIDASDLSHVENAASNSLSGYIVTDLNGDNFTDASDVSIVENNLTLGVSKIVP